MMKEQSNKPIDGYIFGHPVTLPDAVRKATPMNIKDYVEVVPTGLRGKIVNRRVDSLGEAIYTVELDNCTDTPDGLYVARRSELEFV